MYTKSKVDVYKPNLSYICVLESSNEYNPKDFKEALVRPSWKRNNIRRVSSVSIQQNLDISAISRSKKHHRV